VALREACHRRTGVAAGGLAILGVLSALASAPISAAAPQVIVHRAPTSDVRVAGARVAYLRADSSAYRVYVAGPRQRPVLAASGRLVNTFSDPEDFDQGHTSSTASGLQASATRMALLYESHSFAKGVEVGGATSLLGGSLSGPLATYPTCPASRGFSLGGDALARFACAASGGADGTLEVFDLSLPPTSPPAKIQLSPPVMAFAVGGRYLALREQDGRIAVYDRQAGAVAYTIGPSGTSSSSFAVDDGGTLAVCCTAGGRAAWASVAQPSLHELASRPAEPGLWVSDGRIVFVDRMADGSRRLLAADQTGAVHTLTALGAPGVSPAGALDARDGHAAYAVRECDRTVTLYAVDTAGDGAGPAPAAICPLRLSSRTPSVDRRGRIVIGLRCPLGCSVDAGLTLRRGRYGGGRLVVRRERGLAALHGATAHGRGALVFGLSGHTADLLRRVRRVRIELRLRIFEPGAPRVRSDASLALRVPRSGR
jgi:hypothetical protein